MAEDYRRQGHTKDSRFDTKTAYACTISYKVLLGPYPGWIEEQQTQAQSLNSWTSSRTVNVFDAYQKSGP